MKSADSRDTRSGATVAAFRARRGSSSNLAFLAREALQHGAYLIHLRKSKLGRRGFVIAYVNRHGAGEVFAQIAKRILVGDVVARKQNRRSIVGDPNFTRQSSNRRSLVDTNRRTNLEYLLAFGNTQPASCRHIFHHAAQARHGGFVHSSV